MGFSWAQRIAADDIRFQAIEDAVVGNENGAGYPSPALAATQQTILDLLQYFGEQFQNNRHAAELGRLRAAL